MTGIKRTLNKLSLILTLICAIIALALQVSDAGTVATPVFSPDARAIAGLTGVAISCQTSGATIRYTTNNTTPTTTNGTIVASGASVYILPGITLMASAWAAGATASAVKTAAYSSTTTVVTKPYFIPHGTVTVDGNLSEWADAEWILLDQPYDFPVYPSGAPLNPGTPDIAEIYYAVKWATDKVYVAIKVRDTIHRLLDDYLAWDACDLTEYCIHTTGTGPTDYNNYGFAAAQEYVVGIRPDGTSVWTSLGPTGTAAGTGINAAGKVVGQWLNYEVGLIPYQVLNTVYPNQSIISYLSAGDTLGFDPQVVANDGTTHINDYNSIGYTGTRTENMMTGKFMNYTRIGRHLLVMGGSAAGVKACSDGKVVGCSGLVTAVFGDVFYTEASDRSSGIRVRKSGHGMSVGYGANVLGVVATDDVTGERYIDAGQGTVNGSYRQVLTPLEMTNKSLGTGGALDAGLCNVGLYVRTTGRVGDKGSGWFMINDGSGVAVKVVGSVPSGTPYVVVTGVNSCEKDVGGVIQRRIIATTITEVAP